MRVVLRDRRRPPLAIGAAAGNCARPRPPAPGRTARRRARARPARSPWPRVAAASSVRPAAARRRTSRRSRCRRPAPSAARSGGVVFLHHVEMRVERRRFDRPRRMPDASHRPAPPDGPPRSDGRCPGSGADIRSADRARRGRSPSRVGDLVACLGLTARPFGVDLARRRPAPGCSKRITSPACASAMNAPPSRPAVSPDGRVTR